LIKQNCNIFLILIRLLCGIVLIYHIHRIIGLFLIVPYFLSIYYLKILSFKKFSIFLNIKKKKKKKNKYLPIDDDDEIQL
jgi:hypothetical protein